MYFKASKCVKIADFALLESPKSTSLEIWMIEKMKKFSHKSLVHGISVQIFWQNFFTFHFRLPRNEKRRLVYGFCLRKKWWKFWISFGNFILKMAQRRAPFYLRDPTICYNGKKDSFLLWKVQVHAVWKFKDFCITQICVKSILENLEVQKVPFLHFRGCEFCSFQPSKSAKIHKNQNSEPPNVFKWQILHFKNPKNWFHVKS